MINSGRRFYVKYNDMYLKGYLSLHSGSGLLWCTDKISAIHLSDGMYDQIKPILPNYHTLELV